MFDSILNDPAVKKRKADNDHYSSQDSINEEIEVGKIFDKAESDVAIAKNINAIHSTLTHLDFYELKLRDTEMDVIKNTVNLLRSMHSVTIR